MHKLYFIEDLSWPDQERLFGGGADNACGERAGGGGGGGAFLLQCNWVYHKIYFL